MQGLVPHWVSSITVMPLPHAGGSTEAFTVSVCLTRRKTFVVPAVNATLALPKPRPSSMQTNCAKMRQLNYLLA